MTLIKANENLVPFGLDNFFTNDNFFNNKWLESKTKTTLPAINIKENKNDFTIEFASPGFTKKDFHVDIDENILTISANKDSEIIEENHNFTRREFSYASFSRSFTLPKSINHDKIDAKYCDGILKLCIPKNEHSKLLPKKEIKVS